MESRPSVVAVPAASNGSHTVDAFCRATEERAAALATAKVGEAAARLEDELHRYLAADADEIRGEPDVGEGVTLAEAVVRERLERAIAEARDEVGRSVARRLRGETRRLRRTLSTDGSARDRAIRFRAEVKEHLKASLADTARRLRAEARARLVEARWEIASAGSGEGGEVGILAARLVARLVGELDGVGRAAADELGARIESWMDELRTRTDAAERRLDEAGVLARGRIEGYVTASLSRKARRNELRLAREERERRIAQVEARVDARGEEMLRQARVDVDRVRAEATATMRTELAAALERLNELFESETEVLRIGMEGELEGMLRAARKQLTSTV